MQIPRTNSRLRKALKQVQKLQTGWTDISYKVMGKADGTITTGVDGIVFVRDPLNGQVITVYNSIAPTNRPGLQVEVGRLVGEDIYRVKGVRDSYGAPAGGGQISRHSHEELFIGRDRFLPFFVFPIEGGGFTVQIYGDIIIKGDSTFGWIANQTLDLSSYVPTAGAKYVLIEADEDGVIYVTEGDLVDAKELLTIADIPPVTSGRIPSCAVRLYDSQTQLYRDPNSINDFIDVRSITSSGGGGSLPTLDGDRVVITDNAGAITTDPEFIFDELLRLLILGEITAIPTYPSNLGIYGFWMIGEDDISPHLEMVAYGADVAPYITGWKADGTAASPENVKEDQPIFRLRGKAFDGTTWSDTEAAIEYFADGDWVPSSHPVRIETSVVSVGSIDRVLAHVIGSDGVGRGSAMAFQRNLQEDLSLANGASLVIKSYINLNEFSLTLNGDASLTIL